MAVEPGEDGAAAASGGGAAAQQNGHAEHAAAAEDANHVKKSKADKKKEKRQKYKQNKQQRRQQQQQQDEPAAAAAAAAPAEDADIVVEYVAAPAPDIESLLQQVAPAGTSAAPAEAAAAADGGDEAAAAAAAGDEAAGEAAAAAGGEEAEEEEGERGFGGLGLGATPGLGMSGLGFTKGSTEQQDGEAPSSAAAAAAADPEEVMEQFKRVLERFMPQEEPGGSGSEEGADEQEGGGGGEKAERGGDAAGAAGQSDADSDDEEGEGAGGSKLSKKQRKLLSRLKIAELKQKCARPDVVEVWDVTAQDPETLVSIKALRNTVPVPRHWSQKRKYLSGKRGIEKPPFKLPDFIEATGITEMRNAYVEKEEAKKLKQKQRDRMTGKTGKMDIAYEVLYDAFFKHQRKPKMTGLGELYYEGKEYEASLEHLRPGVLSDELRLALAMTDAGPPPWLVNMQRYGPPPSYPNLKVPGLNAPIPPGAQFGYQPGGWGKPPVDSQGNALYGDVFGLAHDDDESDAEVDKVSRWGMVEELEEESSEEEEEEEEEGGGMMEDEEGAGYDAAGLMTSGIATDATGISSLQSGLETPDVALNLRKATDSVAGTESAQAPQLYTVLEQRQAAVGGGLMGSDHVYVLPGQEGAAAGGKRRPPGAPGAVSDVEVTLSPEELEGLDEAGIRVLYESKMAAAQAAAAPAREDFSDLVAGHAAQQKRKAAAKADARAAKKQKDSFKF